MALFLNHTIHPDTWKITSSFPAILGIQKLTKLTAWPFRSGGAFSLPAPMELEDSMGSVLVIPFVVGSTLMLRFDVVIGCSRKILHGWKKLSGS